MQKYKPDACETHSWTVHWTGQYLPAVCAVWAAVFPSTGTYLNASRLADWRRM